MDHICEYEFTVGSSLPFSNQQRFSNSLGFSISESSGISYRTGQNDVCGEECYNLQERSAVHLSPGFQDSTSPVLNGHGSTSPYIPLRKLQDLASMIPTRFSDSTEARQWLDSPQDSVTQDCCVTDKDSCSPSESDSTPEVKLKITKMVMNGKMMFESAICSEVETEDGKGSDEQSPGIEDREAPVLHRAKRMRKKSLEYSVLPLTIVCLISFQCVGRRKKVIPVRFEVGDLIWAKFSRRPWWPGTVCLDPLLKIHTKMKGNRRPCRQYHVQFFGIVTEHAWVASAVVEPFEGRHQYELLVQRNAKNSDDVPRNKVLHISAKVYTQWEAGLVQAEEVLSMSHEDRKSKYCLIGEKKLLPRSEGQTCGIQLYSEPKDIIKATNSGNHVKESEDCHRHNKKNKISTNAKNAKNSSDCKLGKTVRSKFSKSRDPVKDSAHCLYSTNNIVNNLQMNSAILINGVNEAPDELVTGVEGMSTKSSYTVESSSHLTCIFLTFLHTHMIAATAEGKRQRKPSKKLLESTEDYDQLFIPKKKLKPGFDPLHQVCFIPDFVILDISDIQPDSADEINDLDPFLSTSRKSQMERGGGAAKKENVCQLCEKPGELLLCEGQCCGAFHLKCLGLTKMPEGKFNCSECTTGFHTCFVCRQNGEDVKRCLMPLCGKFYHMECIEKYPTSVALNKGFRCSLHVCLSCHACNPTNPRATKGRMMRCVRCPVAYHANDNCLAAGCVVLASNSIICTNHFTARRGCRHHGHVNVSWCFVCSEGGSLLCCESCPAAFHRECLNIEMPAGKWYCNDCKAGKKPRYKDIIWVKLGRYRWWPAEVCHPKNVPTNIQKMKHEIGEFPVRFFGSNDYFWTYQARVFSYMEGDKGSKDKTCKGLNSIFKKALQEAAERFEELKAQKETRQAQEEKRNEKKPPPYKHIKVNKAVGKVQIFTADLSEISRCNCKPTDENPCGQDSECLNRMLMYECHPAVCPAGEKCQNQCFTKRQYPEVEILKTPGRGWGLCCKGDIKKGQFVNEYVGEVIDEEECYSRIKYAQEHDICNFYMLTLDKDRIIDAGPKGNYSRFMNHSCKPNCETQKWTVNGDTRVGLFALCEILSGSELTFNYHLECLGTGKTACKCGAPNCSGYLGVQPKNAPTSADMKKKPPIPRKRKQQSELVKDHEEECFRCGDSGQLVICKKPGCPKVYHADCLNLNKRPAGKWECPWHQCDVCGKEAISFCELCPSSFCMDHREGALFISKLDGRLSCNEHDPCGPIPLEPGEIREIMPSPNKLVLHALQPLDSTLIRTCILESCMGSTTAMNRSMQKFQLNLLKGTLLLMVLGEPN
uniref:Histone-lysine N-methyltransferase, H3 lysine-36 specific n=2 Tax=Callorhinchus milii TaxID=7868 RepID=A0A4W3H6K2_CALMI